MKIAIITDTHFGGRRGSKVFHDFFQKFYDNIIPISKPETYDIDGFKAMMMPWICDENYQETLAAIERSDAKMALSHLELN